MPSGLSEQVRQRRELVKAANKRRPRQQARIPKQRHPDAIALAYRLRLRAILQVAKGLVTDLVVPHLPDLVRAAKASRGDQRMDEDINDELDRLAREFFDSLAEAGELEELTRMIADRTEAWHASQLQAQIRAALGIEIPFRDRGMRARIEGFTQENVALIKSLSQRYFADVEKTLTSMIADGERWETIAEELEARYGVAQASAELVARDQVGKFYGDLNEARQTDLGIDAYFWRCLSDNRVRPEHALRDGKRFLWSEPPEDGHPGEAVNCRCFPDPDFTPLLEGE